MNPHPNPPKFGRVIASQRVQTNFKIFVLDRPDCAARYPTLTATKTAHPAVTSVGGCSETGRPVKQIGLAALSPSHCNRNGRLHRNLILQRFGGYLSPRIYRSFRTGRGASPCASPTVPSVEQTVLSSSPLRLFTVVHLIPTNTVVSTR